MPDASHPDGATLHQRLMAGDVTASAEIAEAWLPPLVEYMKSRFAWVDDSHILETAAIDAMWNYLQVPARYDPEKMNLDRYLRMSARYDMLNLVARRRREQQGANDRPVVELDALDAEQEVEYKIGLSVDEQVDILVSPVWQRLREILPDPADLEAVLLMMEGVRETSEYAAVLGIARLTPKEQEREVKRHKDRLKKRLQRHMQRSELTDHA